MPCKQDEQNGKKIIKAKKANYSCVNASIFSVFKTEKFFINFVRECKHASTHTAFYLHSNISALKAMLVMPHVFENKNK